MKKVLFIKEASIELLDTVNYYENLCSGLGLDFKMEVEKAIGLITLFPEICSTCNDKTQRMSIHRFPYQIIFFSYQDILWIIAVAHHKRFPEYWKNRLNFNKKAR